MKTLRTLIALGLLAAAPASSAALFSREELVMITALDRGSRRLTVTDHRGNVARLDVAPGAELRDAQGAPVAFEELSTYTEVSLTRDRLDRVTRIEIRPPRAQDRGFDGSGRSVPIPTAR